MDGETKVTFTDHMPDLLNVLNELSKKKLIVGIDGDKEEEAIAAYSIEFGEPLLNIPSNSFLIPGMEYGLKKSVISLSDGLQSIFSLTKDPKDTLISALDDMGKTCVAEVKELIQDDTIQESIEYRIE